MLETLTTEELLRHCIQHGPMTEMACVLFERLEAFADMEPMLAVLEQELRELRAELEELKC